jgi:hypothetical protein
MEDLAIALSVLTVALLGPPAAARRGVGCPPADVQGLGGRLRCPAWL